MSPSPLNSASLARNGQNRPSLPRRPRRGHGHRQSRGHVRWRQATACLAAVTLLLLGYGAFQYVNLTTGIKRSDILGGDGSADGATNILVMGLDSRVDENGKPLPREMYDALHAGDQNNGGLNSNVLMLVHLPGDGSKATEISIPRDDYADLPGCPDGQCKGKIKQAYGLAFDQEAKRLAGSGTADPTQREQQERDAGRKAQIAAVKEFLGGVPVDHFVEVTMAAFYQLAQVVQPITVCLAEDTVDRYSGADFKQGRQQIDSVQAVAFVRQRRDEQHPQLNFTDLDRERRQQAFIASLATQLKQAGTLANPVKLSGILDVTKQNTALDSGLNLLSLAEQASQLAGGNVTFYTLPIDHFGKNPLGEDVNFVDLPMIQATVAHLLGTPPPAATAPSSPTATADSSGTTVEIDSAPGQPAQASTLQQGLSRLGYHSSIGPSRTQATSTTAVLYPPGQEHSASRLSALLGGIPTRRSTSVPTGSLRLILSKTFTPPKALTSAAAAPATASSATDAAPAVPVPIPPDGSAPPPNAMSALNGGGVPCVK